MIEFIKKNSPYVVLLVVTLIVAWGMLYIKSLF